MDVLQAFCDSRELLDKGLLCIQHVIAVTDQEGNILFASPVVEDILGFTRDELNGRNLSIVFTPEDMKYLYPNLLYMARRNQPFRGEVMLVRKDGSRFFAFIVFASYFDPRQGQALIVICIQDIDREKQLEKAYREIHGKNLARVADGIAHEIRNPLVAIGGCFKRLRKACGDIPDHDRYYEHITDNLARIEGLIKKVEFFALLPGPRLTKEPVKELVEEAIQPYLQQIEERGIDFTISVKQVILFVDKDLVVKAFGILIENALDALSKERKILIHSEIKENQCKICVTDTGSGILPKDMPYIFNPFFSTKADGAGMDLAVVKRVMDSHGGHVEVESKPGKGTTLSLQFPLERRRAIRLCRLESQEQQSAKRKAQRA